MALSNKTINLGILVIRLTLGFSMIAHGYPKMAGGQEAWGNIGAAMGYLGLGFAPIFWGFMAAFSEFIGGIAIASGLFFRPFCSLVFITMMVAFCYHMGKGDTLMKSSHALELAMIAVGLFLTNAGDLSLDRILRGKK
jgi:putative oxidoreductase